MCTPRRDGDSSRPLATARRIALPEAFLLALGGILLEIGYTRILSFKLVDPFPAIVFALAMLGLGVGGILVAVVGRFRLAVVERAVPAFCLIIYRRLEAWHDRRELPRVWEWTIFLAICATNLWLVRLAYPIRHYYYMHSGLFPLGMFMLYLMTYYEVLGARRSTMAVESAADGVEEPSDRPARTVAATRAA